MYCKGIFLGVFFFGLTGFAQLKDPSWRSYANLRMNNVKTVFTNSGVISQPRASGPHLSWEYSVNGYASDMSIVLGLELPIKDYTGDGNPDTLHYVTISPAERPGGGKFAPGGKFWGFEPSNGFYNSGFSGAEKIAHSANPQTWPALWPDHPEWGSNVWYGIYGPNTFTGGDEYFYQLNDKNDEEATLRYGFLPDTLNPNKTGRGIVINTWLIQFPGTDGLQDVLYKIYDIKNESCHQYKKVVFGEVAGTYIGDDGDEWNDDVSLFYSKDDIIRVYDHDKNIRTGANPNWVGRVGEFGQRFIDLPSGKGIASFDYFVPASAIKMSNNTEMWNRLVPGRIHFPLSVIYQDSIPVAVKGEDGDYIYGSPYFSLSPGGVKRIANVIVFGYSKEDLIWKAKVAEAFYNSKFNIAHLNNKIILDNFRQYQSIAGSTAIRWHTEASGGSVEIWLTTDDGDTWRLLDKNASNSGVYQWNSALAPDCAFAQLRLFYKNQNDAVTGFCTSSRFTIRNNTTQSYPYLKIVTKDLGNVVLNACPLTLMIGNTDPVKPMSVKVYSSQDNVNFSYSHSFPVMHDTVPQVKEVDLRRIPNSDKCRIKLVLSDGTRDTADITMPFTKNTPRISASPLAYQFINRTPDAFLEVRVVDPAVLTRHTYVITFDDTTSASVKYISIVDATTGQSVFNRVPFYPNSEIPAFDGITIYTEDFFTKIDTALSKWNHYDSTNLYCWIKKVNFPDPYRVVGMTPPFDYAIVFSNQYVDSSNDFSHLLAPISMPTVQNINFKCYDVSDRLRPERIKFGYFDSEPPHVLSADDCIFLSAQNGSRLSWMVTFLERGFPARTPGLGDTLFVITQKGLSIYDTLLISGNVLSTKDKYDGNREYALAQNYPNPFNPATTINFSLSHNAFVTIKVFDVLGNELQTLVRAEVKAGSHKTVFNGATYASGIYLCRMEAGGVQQTRKLLLLK